MQSQAGLSISRRGCYSEPVQLFRSSTGGDGSPNVPTWTGLPSLRALRQGVGRQDACFIRIGIDNGQSMQLETVDWAVQ